jgi:hypothetical protein
LLLVAKVAANAALKFGETQTIKNENGTDLFVGDRILSL